MARKEQIMQFVKDNGGTITTSQLKTLGILRGNLMALVDSGQLERASRGVYILPSVWEDEILGLQQRYKRGIYSHGTALFLLNMTDRTPNRYAMTFPSNYNVTNPKADGVLCHRVKDEFYDMGITPTQTPAGNVVKAYCAERTLCDLLRPRSNVDIQITAFAFKQYALSQDKNIPLLSEYSKLLKVESKLRTYMEVLL